jgi:hypothetical protein
MTPAAKEGLPAVVGELVAEMRKRADCLPGGCDWAYVVEEDLRRWADRLSALTAEAGKGEGVVVDDLMVERARKAYHSTIGAAQVFCPKCGGTGRDRDNYNDCEKCEGNRWIWPEGAPDPMRAALEAALSTATPAGEWRPTFGREPEGWRNHRLMFVCWEGGAVEASECYGSIAWEETTHWMPATKPASPRGASESK